VSRDKIFLGILIVLAATRVAVGADPIEFPFLGGITGPLEGVRDRFVENIEGALPEPEASYLGGLLVGVRTQIPKSLKDAFRHTGTSHLIALSGYNVGVIGRYLGGFSSSLWFPVTGIIIFVLATGAASSLVRAAIMGILALLATRYGHTYNVGVALLFAACIMIIVNPTILFGDVGFQLSVAATWGLMYLSPKIDPYFKKVPNILGIRESISATLAAEAATLPFILYYFGRFSILSPFTNVLVLAAIPPTMFFGFLTGMAGFFSSLLATLLAWPTYLLLSYQLFIIKFFAKINF
jgi:competence protein ComEC